MWTNLRLKSRPQFNTQKKECVVKISTQNTQGIRHNNSKIESKQTGNLVFPKTERPGFLPYIFFLCFLFGRASLTGYKYIWKYLCKCFQNLSLLYELKIKLQKLGKIFANLERGCPWCPISFWNIFRKRIYFWNLMEESQLNLWRNGTNLSSNRQVFS